jgi:hypothetical protein
MENIENSTSAKRKNNFSIENILSRPDNNLRENREVRSVKFMRQNPFQNNHVLFNQNNFMFNKNTQELKKASDSEIKLEEENRLEIVENSDDHESHSEIASDDGNSNSGNCKKILKQTIMRTYTQNTIKKISNRRKNFKSQKIK